jgi:hypothetical protein
MLTQAACGSEPGLPNAPAPMRDAGALEAGTDSDAGLRPSLQGSDFVAFTGLAVPADGVLDVTFDVPPEARAFVLSAQSPLPGYSELMGLVGPDGTILFDAAAPDRSSYRPALPYNLERAFPLAVLYPGAPGAVLAPGRYLARLGFVPDTAPSGPLTVDVDLVWQRTPAPQRVAATVWLARGARWDAATLLEEPSFQEAFTLLRALFTSAGITLDPLETRDLGLPEADLATVDGDSAQGLDALLSALESEPAGGLDFILVDRIEAVGKTVRGKTTGIPGPPAHPELTRRGAVVLALEALPGEPQRIAEAFAHEAAHYLGLRHTTEMDGSDVDSLPDTPECPAELASYVSASGARLLSAEDCQAYDGTNLLFPMPPISGEQQSLTAQQVELLKRHALVR